MADETEVNVEGIDIEGIDLSGIDLSGIDLGGIDLDASLFSPQQVDPNSISSGFGRGIDQAQFNLYKSAEALADVFDWDTASQWARDNAAANSEEMAQYGEPVRWKDVDGVGQMAEWLIGNGATLLPQVLGTVGAAGLGAAAVATSPVAAPAALGAAGAVSAWSLGQNIGEVNSRLEDLGHEDMGVAGWALTGGLTAIDTLGGSLLLKPFFRQGAKQAVKQFGKEATEKSLVKHLVKTGVGKEAAVSMAKGVVTEGGTEAAHTALLEAEAHRQAGVELDTDEFLENVTEAGLLGGVFGGAGGHFGSVIRQTDVANFYSPKVLDEARKQSILNKVRENKGVAGTVMRGYDKITGKAADFIKAKVEKVQAGMELYKIPEKLAEINRLKTAEGTHRLGNVQKIVKNHYKGKGNWKKQLATDLKGKVDNDATKAYRALMDWHYMEAKKLGIATQRLDWYRPARMDKKRILDNKEQFVQDLEAQGYDRVKHADKIAQYFEALETGDFSTFHDPLKRLTDADMQDGDARSKTFKKLMEQDISGKMKGGRVGSEMGNIEAQRYWNADQDFYDSWSIDSNDGAALWDSTKMYIHDAAHRFAGAETLGVNGEKLNRQILMTQEELVNDFKERLSTDEVQQFYKIFDAYDGKLRYKDPVARAAVSAITTVVNIATLPLVTLGSFTEIINIAANTDFKHLIKSVGIVTARAGKEIAHRSLLLGETDGYSTRATQASMAGQTFSQANQELLNRMHDPGMASWARKTNTAFFHMSGLTLWNQTLRAFGAEAARLKMQSDIDIINNSPSSDAAVVAAQTRLAELNLTEADIKAMKPGELSHEQDIQRRNQAIAKGINTFNRKVALDPSFADRPVWMSDQRFWILSRLQGYPTMFTNTILPMLGKKATSVQGAVDLAFIVGFTTMLGAAQIVLRDAVAGREDEREPAELFGNSIMRNLGARPLQLMVDAIKGVAYGRDPATTFAGPVASKGGDLMALTRRLTEGNIDMEEYLFKLGTTLTPMSAMKHRLD